jgi:hypothetical protein
MNNEHEKKVPDKDQKAGKTTFNPRECRICDRRKKSDSGYMYISTVGWIDRRETGRRSNDFYMF